MIAAVVFGAGLGLTTAPASALKTRVNVHEECTSKLLPGNGVVLTTTLTIRNAPRGKPATVRFRAGWSVGTLYPKSKGELVIRVGPGRSAQRSVTRTILAAPELWRLLRETRRVGCASEKSYTLG